MSDLRQRKLYHEVKPSAEQDSYVEFAQPRFLISAGSGRSLVKNSVRILGDVLVQSSGVRATAGIQMSRNAGAHALFNSIQTSFAGGPGSGSVGGTIENLTNYPRWVTMNAVGSLNELDMLNGQNQCELRASTDGIASKYAQGIAPGLTTGTVVIEDADFSIKPEIGLNRMSGGDLPFDKSGIVSVMCTLARNSHALFGASQDANASYTLSNLRCTYMSVPDSKTPEPSVMNIEYPISSNILTGSATLSTNVAAVCSGVSTNFVATHHSGVNVFDSNAMENPYQLQSIHFIMNDKTNSLVTYKITDQTEMLERAVDSLYNSGRNQVSLNTFRNNQSFCVGLDFDGPVDLSSNRFTFQIDSGISNIYPFNIHQYFHSTVSV
tara:strand:- start:626 stop:1765 length:1140 start_codon:yes stop_codon:yes gene_type:complete